MKKKQIVTQRNVTVLKRAAWSGLYVRVPVEVLRRVFSDEVSEQRLGRILLYLFFKVYYKDGFVKLGKRIYPCLRGEYVGTMAAIACKCDIHESLISRYIKELILCKMIATQRLARGTRIQLLGFDDFMQSESLLAAKRLQHPMAPYAPALPRKSPAPEAAPAGRNYYRDVVMKRCENNEKEGAD